MNTSYSHITKAALLEITDKKRCCQRVFSDIISLKDAEAPQVRADLIRSAPEHFKCQNCRGAFLRALFVFCGNITDPAKRYHLELSFESEGERDSAADIVNGIVFPMKTGQRRGRFLLYIKSSNEIEDFLAVIGANKAAFELINSKIVREVREDANRQSNCDMANIRKSLSATKKYLEVIEDLKNTGMIVRLGPDLRETARLRSENTQASMAELATMHSTPISKSGVKHRLDKIVELWESYKER